MDNYDIRELEKQDYYKGFLELLEELTIVNKDNISFDDFSKHFDNMNSTTYVIINNNNNKVIGCASLLVEYKFIHGLSKAAHIEDVVISEKYRGCGLGKKLIKHIVELAKNEKCYKIVLNCTDDKKEFYKKCGFMYNSNQMVIYT